MKKLLYIIAVTVLSAASYVNAHAQQSNLRTAYFLDGYTYRYRFNPSFAPERGFFAIPALGNIGIGAESNLGLSNFYFPTGNGSLNTFIDDAVSDDKFMSGIKKRNLLNVNSNLNIFALGFWSGESYHTLDMSVKLNTRANLPKSLFHFAKVGTAGGNTSWQINDLGIRADAHAEIAYGYSRSVNENLCVGGRAKFLIGVARTEVMIDQLNLTVGRSKWEASAVGHAELSGPVSIGTKEDSDLVDYGNVVFYEDVNEIMDGMKNYGFALDLGASYNFLEYFTASLSLLDVGFISWNNTTSAKAASKPWTFDGIGIIKTDGTTDFGEKFSNFGDQMLDMVQLEKNSDGQKKTHALSATIHAGIEARVPFYQRLTFGFLATHRFDGPFSWTEARLSANLAPVNCISLAASYAASTYGNSVGAVLNFHFPGLNLYLGTDSFLPFTNLATNYIPVSDLNTNLTLGLNITFGKAHGIYHDMRRAKKAAKKAAKAVAAAADIE